MDALFSPFTIKGLYLKNRIVMPPLASFLIEADGSYTDKTIEHYRRRAAGGPAMVITEAHGVSPEGVVSAHQARLYDDCFIEGLSRIADAIRSEGAVPAIQIHHAGRQVPYRVIKQKPYAPSPLPCPTIRGDVEPLSIPKIQKIIRQFGDAAVRALQAGFELLEIHGAHGYLVNQFLSPFSNIRTDAYGTDWEGRSRFAVEIVKEVRSRIGDDFPLSFKISAQEFVPNGLTTQTSIPILQKLVAAGIDIVQVSAGTDASAEWICQPMFMKQACLADSAKKIKAALDIPVMVVGRINDPLIADDIIRQQKADIVCMGRGLLADPRLPIKAQAGRLADIRPCIACNTCMQAIFRKGKIECLVNPTLGRETEMAIVPTPKPKKIMVVGGGPSGMNMAWVAAKRGHQVTLFEKMAALGGQLNIGSAIFFKKEMLNLTNFLKNQIMQQQVECRLSTEVTAEIIQAEAPDVVVIATGSKPLLPKVAGIDLPFVHVVPEIFNGTRPKLHKVVVIGGGDTGCEVALELSHQGYQVTIVEQQPRIGMHLEAITKKMIFQRLKEKDAVMLANTRLIRIAPEGVYVQDEAGKQRIIEADSVIIAMGNKRVDALSDQAEKLGFETYRIGDCREVRSAKDAIAESALLARRI